MPSPVCELVTRSLYPILPYISFDRLSPLLARASVWGRDHLGRFLDPDQAEAVGEWGARVVLDHLRSPGSPTGT